MAWNIHWQCCFQSMNGTQYAVNICEQNYQGSIIQLQGGDKPFTTQEDDSDDIFTPIRIQTGYLRVVDPDGSLLEDILPNNNTERLVQLFHGTYTGTWPNGTFTHADDALDWQGFLQAQAFTQPWDGQSYILELPVKSILGALEDTNLVETYASTEGNVAALILAAFSQFGLVETLDLRYIHVISDATDAVNNLLLPILQWSVFFDEETIVNEGDSYSQLVGMSYYDALASVLALYGLQLREKGADFYFVQYDSIQPYHDGLRRQTINFNNLRTLAGGTTIVRTESEVSSVDMLTALTFKGADNAAGYVQGGRSAKVVLGLKSLGDLIILPSVTQDRSAIYKKDLEDAYKLYVQAHHDRANNKETFTYVKQNRYQFVEYTDYDEMLTCSWVTGYTYNPYYSTSTPQVTGMFPCRYALVKEAGDKPILKNGLYFSYQYTYSGIGTRTNRLAYSIKTELPYTLHNGWILISIGMLGTHFNSGDGKVVCGAIKQIDDLLVALRFGNKFWNGSEWVNGTNPLDHLFQIEIQNGFVIPNQAEESSYLDGYAIPISNMSGDIELYISNYVYSYMEGEPLQNLLSSCGIITDITVSHVPVFDLLESDRQTNVYLQDINVSGFPEEKSIDLIVGTWNNNKRTVNFLTDSNYSYIETMTYRTRYSTTKEQRPELHLLDRMVAQYNHVRRTFNAVVQRGTEMMQTRYTYLARTFFGLKSKTDWRDDTEQVTFIEVS